MTFDRLKDETCNGEALLMSAFKWKLAEQEKLVSVGRSDNIPKLLIFGPTCSILNRPLSSNVLSEDSQINVPVTLLST